MPEITSSLSTDEDAAAQTAAQTGSKTELDLMPTLHKTTPESVVHCVTYHRSTGKRIAEIPLCDVSEVLAENSDVFVWIGLFEPSLEVMQEVQQEFGLHELAIEDATRSHQRAKVESYGDTQFILVRTAQLHDKTISYGMTALFLGKRFLISVRRGASKSYTEVRENCEKQPEKLKMGPGFVLYSILDFVVDNFFPITEQLGMELKALETEIFSEKFSRKTLRVLYDLKAEILHLRMTVSPFQDVCNYFLNHNKSEFTKHFPKTAVPYFRDIQDHVLRTIDAIEGLSEMLRVSMETYLALVGVGQNEVVKKLASWAGILAVPTMIASFYGMNFENMPETKWHYGYFACLFVMFFVASLLYKRLRKARWL